MEVVRCERSYLSLELCDAVCGSSSINWFGSDFRCLPFFGYAPGKASGGSIGSPMAPLGACYRSKVRRFHGLGCGHKAK